MYEAKNSKICNFWTFWPVIQPINGYLEKVDPLFTDTPNKLPFNQCC